MNWLNRIGLLLLVPPMLFAADGPPPSSLSLPATEGSGISSADRPNVVVLLVDDLGWGDFGCYGARFNETPHIDKLASQGMRFSNAYAACTVCSPSRAAILTGCYPARLRLTDWITGHRRANPRLLIPDWTMRMDHERVLLPEAMKEAGYETIFLGKWHLMPIGQPDFDDHVPTRHGFDINVGGREWGQPKGRGRYFSPFDLPNLDDGEPGAYLTDKLTDAAVAYLDTSSRKRPFLMYFSYYTLHGPIMSPPDLVEKYQKKAVSFDNRHGEELNAARAGMVESLDRSVGRIMDKLEKLGIEQNTVILLTGDNGGDRDRTTGGLKGYKGLSHEGGVREPLVVKWPGQVRPGSTCDEPVIGMDIYPTVLEIAGLPARPDQHRDGVSLVPLLTGGSTDLRRDVLYWHYPHYHRTLPYGAIREGDMKLIEFFEDGSLELYDLGTDPHETTNLAAAHPEKAARLLARLVAWRESVGAQMPAPNPDYDPDATARKQPRKKKAAAK